MDKTVNLVDLGQDSVVHLNVIVVEMVIPWKQKCVVRGIPLKYDRQGLKVPVYDVLRYVLVYVVTSY